MTMPIKMYRAVFTALFFSYFSSLLLASDIDLLTEYRINGISNLEEKLDKGLSKQKYWQKYLKKVDTKFGYIESYNNVLACDKSKSGLLVYVKDANNTYKLRKEYSAYTGKEKGDKKAEGDLKTPIGIYDLVKKLSKVDEFYGPLAFVTSYPNIYDKYNGKTGRGIWIHGLPLHEKRDTFTKGCIAIGNKSIECLNKNLDIKKTVLIINEQCKYTQVSKKTLAAILSQIYMWRYSWKYNNLENYLSFYADDFLRFDGMDINRFKKYKTRIFAKSEKKSIIFKNLNVIPYPMQENTYKITFDEIYKSNSFAFSGQKTLIVRLNNAKMKIVTEK